MIIEIPLQDPRKVFEPLKELISDVLTQMVFEKLIEVGDSERASAGLMGSLADIMKWRFVADSGKAWAAVQFEIKDDDAARTILRQAALEAVRLKP